MCNNSKER